MDKKILEKQITTLELDKILKILSGYSAIPDAVENCCNIKPYFEIEEVERLLTQTGDAYMLIARFGAPSFGGASNCNNALARAEKVTGVEYYNIGTGVGYSVLDIVNAYEKATGIKIN